MKQQFFLYIYVFLPLINVNFILTLKGPFEQTPNIHKNIFFFVFRAIIKISTLQHYDGAIVLLVFEVVTSTVRRFLRKAFLVKEIFIIIFKKVKIVKICEKLLRKVC